MDSTGTSAAPTTLYINVASMVAKAPSSTPSCPQNGRNDGTGGNQTKYNNKNRNSGNDDGNNDKNSNDSGGCGGSSGQTTTPTGSASMTNTLWPSCDRTTSKMKGLSPKIISGDSRRSENAQTHTNKHTIPNMKFKLKLL
jgi:hypothetical protein